MRHIDRIIRCITHDGSIMISAVDTTESVAITQECHSMSATASAVLGRTLTAASIMGSMLKSDQASITLKIAGNGPIGGVVAISDSHGNIRGYVEKPQLELPIRSDGKLDVGGAVGKEGRMGVIRDFGTGEPYVGQIELVSGEIAEDITNYYAVSEQIPTVCALGVLTDKESRKVLLAGGLFIQVLPGAYDSDIARLESDLTTLEPMTTMLAKGLTLEQICEKAIPSFQVDKLDETPIHYACTCSKDKYSRALITLGPEELLSLPAKDGFVEAVCPYCSKTYHFNGAEIQHLADISRK